MTTLHKLYIGTKHKDTHEEQSLKDCLSVLKDSCLNKYTDGYTITHAMGYYKHFNGEFVNESTIIVELIDYPDSIFPLINAIKFYLNQESIYVTEQEIKARLY